MGTARFAIFSRFGFKGEPHDISSDGTQLLSPEILPGGSYRLLVTQLEEPKKSVPHRALVTSDQRTWAPRFSPDGRWFAYESGGTISVQPFPGPGRRQQVVPAGTNAEWRKHGKEIVYTHFGDVMAVAVETAAGQVRFGAPHKLFSGFDVPAGFNLSDRVLAVSKDGSRFYSFQGVEQPESTSFTSRPGGRKSEGSDTPSQSPHLNSTCSVIAWLVGRFSPSPSVCRNS